MEMNFFRMNSLVRFLSIICLALLLSSMMLFLAGCVMSVYQLEFQEEDTSSSVDYTYRVVDELKDGENDRLDENCMPIVVNTQPGGEKKEVYCEPLMFLSAGIVPRITTITIPHWVGVRTPSGDASCNYAIEGIELYGWLGFLFPNFMKGEAVRGRICYSTADPLRHGERTNSANSKFSALETRGDSEAVKRLVAQTWPLYHEFAVKHNVGIAAREAEKARIAAREAADAKAREDARRSAEKAKETARIAVKKEIVRKFLDKEDYDAVIDECNKNDDKAKYPEFADWLNQAEVKKEQKRIAELKRTVESKFVAGEYTFVVQKCNAEIEGQFEADPFFVSYAKRAAEKSDRGAAVKLYMHGAKNGEVRSMGNLGYCYLFGRGVDGNAQEAVKWLTSGAKDGDDISLCYLGYCFREGLGVHKDVGLANENLRQAAEKGNVEAMLMLADYSKSQRDALDWLEKAVGCGSTVAMNRMAWHYQWGVGVEKDEMKAVGLYRSSAEAGDAEGMFHLGDCYRYRECVERVEQYAVEWYKKAAEKGNAEALIELNNKRNVFNGVGFGRNILAYGPHSVVELNWVVGGEHKTRYWEAKYSPEKPFMEFNVGWVKATLKSKKVYAVTYFRDLEDLGWDNARKAIERTAAALGQKYHSTKRILEKEGSLIYRDGDIVIVLDYNLEPSSHKKVGMGLRAYSTPLSEQAVKESSEEYEKWKREQLKSDIDAL